MTFTLDSLAALPSAPFDTVIDVRSPAEYAEDHLPGAISLPVLSDAERARVGTIYVQEDPFLARKIGAALVARNAARHIETALAGKPGGWKPLVYCWRGGQRSGAFAAILGQIGWRVATLEGGYRSYRRLVKRAMHDDPVAHRLVLLDGNTGTAKTAMLHRLAAAGTQVIDLEGLAAHRGSLLGATAQPQPSQKAFEGALAGTLARLDPARPVIVEAESSKIGERLIPPSLWAAMKHAPRITVTAPVSERAGYLVRAYGDLVADRAALDAALAKLTRLRGRERVANWRALAAEGRHEALATELIEHHYDPGYARSRARHGHETLGEVQVERLDEAGLDAAAARIATLAASG